jgi:8-oxo-dGTP pyrophosphatase MutT (NUDIX family)
LVWSLPAGAVDGAKHGSLEDAARAELSEECGLRGGTLIRLLPDTHPGLLETKWCRNRFTPFLVLDPECDKAPGQRDAEEAVLTSHRVPLRQLMDMLYGDDILLHSVATTHLAVRELLRRGLLDVSLLV